MTPERLAIVDALATVEGIHAVPYTPAPIVAGQAWPGWSGTTYPHGACHPIRGYYVFCALPNGAHGATVDAGDETADTIAVALEAVGKIVRVEPWAWPVEPGQQAIPVIRITLEV